MILQGVLIIFSSYYALRPSVVPVYCHNPSLRFLRYEFAYSVPMSSLEHREICYCCYLWDDLQVVTYNRVGNVIAYYSILNPHKKAWVLLHF